MTYDALFHAISSLCDLLFFSSFFLLYAALDPSIPAQFIIIIMSAMDLNMKILFSFFFCIFIYSFHIKWHDRIQNKRLYSLSCSAVTLNWFRSEKYFLKMMMITWNFPQSRVQSAFERRTMILVGFVSCIVPNLFPYAVEWTFCRWIRSKQFTWIMSFG